MVGGGYGLASLGFTKSDFMQAGYVTQIGYPPLRIDILNTIDGVKFEDAFPNKLLVDLNGVDNIKVHNYKFCSLDLSNLDSIAAFASVSSSSSFNIS